VNATRRGNYLHLKTDVALEVRSTKLNYRTHYRVWLRRKSEGRFEVFKKRALTEHGTF